VDLRRTIYLIFIPLGGIEMKKKVGRPFQGKVPLKDQVLSGPIFGPANFVAMEPLLGRPCGNLGVWLVRSSALGSWCERLLDDEAGSPQGQDAGWIGGGYGGGGWCEIHRGKNPIPTDGHGTLGAGPAV